MDHTYYPEGMFPESLQARGMTRDQLKKAWADGVILEAVARSATAGHDLIVDLGDVQGIIPREETAIGISDGSGCCLWTVFGIRSPRWCCPAGLHSRRPWTICFTMFPRAPCFLQW